MRYLTVAAILSFAATSMVVYDANTPEQASAQSSPSTNSATVEANDYAITIHTDKDMYDPEDPIVFTFTAKYNGTTPVNFDTSYGVIYSGITVLHEGRPCPQTLFCKRAVGNDFYYGKGVVATPGFEHSFPCHLNRLFDMTLTGEYQIYFRRNVPNKKEAQGWKPVDCGPITIRINENALKNTGKK